MFLLFLNLYRAMFQGQWNPYQTIESFFVSNKDIFNAISMLVTSIFGDNTYGTLGDVLSYNVNSYLNFISFILATITSIGIVVVATKGIKKLFTVFFYGVS